MTKAYKAWKASVEFVLMIPQLIAMVYLFRNMCVSHYKKYNHLDNMETAPKLVVLSQISLLVLRIIYFTTSYSEDEVLTDLEDITA